MRGAKYSPRVQSLVRTTFNDHPYFLPPYHDVRRHFEQDVSKEKDGQGHVELSACQLEVVFESCNSGIANVGAIQETEEIQERPDGDEAVVELAFEGADGGAVRVELCRLANVLLLKDVNVFLLIGHCEKSR